MKNKILATLIVISAFIAGYSINSIAISNTTPEYKIAIVDIATILKNSKEINALKLEQEKQMQNMQATIDKAKAEISKEQDQTLQKLHNWKKNTETKLTNKN